MPMLPRSREASLLPEMRPGLTNGFTRCYVKHAVSHLNLIPSFPYCLFNPSIDMSDLSYNYQLPEKVSS